MPRSDPGSCVLFADPWLLALVKPSGLLSQPGLGPELADSLISRAQERWPEVRLVHRLDRDTSGLILLARDATTHRVLSAAFAERRVRKTYLAMVQGLPADRGGIIDQPLARIATRPPRYGVVPLECGGKSAFTRWRVLRRFVGSSLLLLQPRTGRSHQLRVHLAALGHPVLGDPLYGDPLYGEPAPAPRLQLHAAGLQLLHPATGKPLHLRSRCFGDGLVGVDPLN
ncbi:Dual-specificity RNA pseudouridine synthase RluA [Cyanobium usitatum str. Tous]|uniref:RluA family pseudouridine synthase n=1 Tax=Cyanobium usitatum TaxID=2304190 RepID=UPI002AD38E12|nr:RluA family pseudouridine synthase [Cyanobium usitatum]CAK6689367.1 Dual-specificity RNA pseudouridine synthase RluA [Cyanobium usitatum str. Tous]